MKITIWQNCRAVNIFEIPDAPGRDVSIDPWNNLIGTGTELMHECPIPYQGGLRASTTSID